MIRGVSTRFTFDMPCYYTNLKLVLIEFWQEGHSGLPNGYTLPITKTLEQCKPMENPKQISVILGRHETIRFTDDRKAYVRFYGVEQNGHVFGGNQEIITVYPASDVSMLEEDLLPTPDYNNWEYIDCTKESDDCAGRS